MPAIKYKVNLTDDEKFQLEALVHIRKKALLVAKRELAFC